MKFLTFLGLFIFLSFSNLTSQSIDIDTSRTNTLYFEGHILRHDFSDGFVSMNYERKFGQKKKRLLRIGIYPDFESTVSFPIVFGRILFPKSKHKFEYGFGGIIRFELYQGHIITDIPALIIPVMYRYESKQSFFLRAGINLYLSYPILPSPAISIGYIFKRKEEKIYKDYIQI